MTSKTRPAENLWWPAWLGVKRRVAWPRRLLAAGILLAVLGMPGCRGSDDKAGNGGKGQQTGAGAAGNGPPSTEPTRNDPPIFRDATDELGLDFTHTVGEPGTYFFPEIAAGGAAFIDYNGDGRLDVYLTNGNFDDQAPPPERPRPTDRLFRQNEDGRFEDVTAAAGLGDSSYGMGVAVGDIDNNGHPDLYVSNYGPDRLYLNQGDGTFTDVTMAAGIDNIRWSASACFVDYDRDGWLDLFVANYVNYKRSRQCSGSNGVADYCGPDAFPHTIDKLYRNVTGERRAAGDEDGAVRFVDMTGVSGIGTQRGPGLGVAAADFNGDDWPDLYVANDGVANFLWINQQDGTFVDEAVLLGASHDAQGRAQAGMGVAFADINGDDQHDLLVTHLVGETNALYVSGESGFTELAVSSGLGVPGYPRTGFGTVFFDVEQDGDLDVAVVQGRVARSDFSTAAAAAFWDDYAEENHLFLNQGDQTWVRMQSSSDAFTSGKGVSRALCKGDVDNDGDLDLLVVNAGDRVRLYMNDCADAGHWLQVRAVLPSAGGRDAYGATIRVVAGEHSWRQVVAPGTSYLSSHDPRAHFGLGNTDTIDRVDVVWPDGKRETFPGGPTDRVLTISAGEGTAP